MNLRAKSGSMSDTLYCGEALLATERAPAVLLSVSVCASDIPPRVPVERSVSAAVSGARFGLSAPPLPPYE